MKLVFRATETRWHNHGSSESFGIHGLAQYQGICVSFTCWKWDAFSDVGISFFVLYVPVFLMGSETIRAVSKPVVILCDLVPWLC